MPAVMVSHESLAGLLALSWLLDGAQRWLADRLNARTAAQYDRVVCTTAWAAAEFRRIGVANLVEVPLGVDLELFHPGRRDRELRAQYARPGQILIVHCGRLSPEKCPERSVAALAELRSTGMDAVLVVAGDGPLYGRLVRQAEGLPVRFTRFLTDRRDVAALLANADVAIAPGPIETFGLVALEALACGTPVVVDQSSALPEVVGDAGIAVPGDRFTSGVRQLLVRPEPVRRAAARARAETFDWSRAATGFLAAHGLPATAHGLPATAHGLPTTAHGLPTTAHGLPTTAHGLPATALATATR